MKGTSSSRWKSLCLYYLFCRRSFTPSPLHNFRDGILEDIGFRNSDERREEEIRKVETQLKGRVHFLQARELENYLLVPHAIHSALKAKYADNPPMLTRIDSITEEQVTKVVHEAADNLYGTVLLKR